MADLDTRLRNARPSAADVDPGAFDGELLARVRRGPPPRGPSRRRIAIPAVAAVVAAAALISSAVVARRIRKVLSNVVEEGGRFGLKTRRGHGRLPGLVEREMEGSRMAREAST